MKGKSRALSEVVDFLEWDTESFDLSNALDADLYARWKCAADILRQWPQVGPLSQEAKEIARGVACFLDDDCIFHGRKYIRNNLYAARILRKAAA